MKLVKEKFIESLTSILPIIVIVFLLSLTPIFDLSAEEQKVFTLSAMFLIVGMSFFNIGAELSMTPMGDFAGSGLIKTKKILLILIVAFIMGCLVTIAEPDLMVLADQVEDAINSTSFIISVGLGVGVFLLFAILRILFNRQLSNLLLLFYMLIFAYSALLIETGKSYLLPLAFDSGGVTTGPITVPFLMAFGAGIATTLGGKNSNENSFGFVALCSIGPILVVLLFLILAKNGIAYTLPDYSVKTVLEEGVLNITIEHFIGVFRALAFIFIFFLVLNIFIMKLPVKKIIQIVVGIIITLIGLVMFLTSATVGFLPVGYLMGSKIIQENIYIAVGICFVIGAAVVLAEPAIHVLTSQVEDITGGAVSRRAMLVALSAGVGVALALSAIRIILKFSILFYLIPGYFISLAFSLFVPRIYTAIAFDSGGVASGPLTSTFILPFMIGACASLNEVSDVMSLAFGVVALVAMIPLISIQILGFRAIFAKKLRDRISMNRILNADDNQIIYF